MIRRVLSWFRPRPKMRFTRNRPEFVCGKVTPRRTGGHKVICLRIDGHKGACLPMARQAAEADGVCHWCRTDNGEHEVSCGAI